MPLDTTPPYPQPAETKIEAAARDLPDVLAEMPPATQFVNPKPPPAHRLVLASDLAEALATRKSHSPPAAAFAVDRLVASGLLAAEIADRGQREIVLGGPSEFLQSALDAIDPQREDREHSEPRRFWPASGPVHSGEGVVPFDKFLVRSSDRLWEANRAGMIFARAGFQPNKPRPARAAIDAAKRVIQQQIFDHSNAEGEDPPASPHRVVNGAVLLVNCGRRTTHPSFQWAVYELASDELLRVRPAARPQFISVYGEHGFGVGGSSNRLVPGKEIVLREDETPLGLFVLETTDRLFAGEIESCADGECAPVEDSGRGVVQVSQNHPPSQAAAAHDHGLMVYDAITVLPGVKVDLTGYSCKVIAGDRPTLCPDASPVLPPSMLSVALRAVLRLNRLPAGTTIHWVGHETGIRNRCKCHPDAPYAAPFDRERWPAVVTPPPLASADAFAAPDAPSQFHPSERQDSILAAMYELGATGRNRRKTRREIASTVQRGLSAASIGADCAVLKENEYVGSQEGSGGGCWLTSKGIGRAKQILSPPDRAKS
jgi:hypothetical protein